MCERRLRVTQCGCATRGGRTSRSRFLASCARNISSESPAHAAILSPISDTDISVNGLDGSDGPSAPAWWRT